MTGPEHYREAERLLSASRNNNGQYGGFNSENLAKAQVHATLAAAAASALNALPWPDNTGATQEWAVAIGAVPPESVQ